MARGSYVHGNSGAPLIGAATGIEPGSRVCIPVPLYHCFGMVMGNLGCLTLGAAMVYPSESFDPAAALRAIAQFRCDVLYGVPTMFIAILNQADFASHDLDGYCRIVGRIKDMVIRGGENV